MILINNYLQILVITLITYIFAMVWYSPGVFGKSWAKMSKIKNIKPSFGLFIKGFVNTLIFNVALALIIQYIELTTFLDGVKFGALIWLGFIATTQFSRILWERIPARLFWINSLYYLINITILSGIYSVWN